MLKACLTALVVWFGLNAAAFAQAPPESRMVLAREVMMLSGGEQAFNDMVEQIRPMMIQDMRAAGATEEAAQHVYSLMVEEFAREAPRFVELGAIAYANAFTDQELVDIAAFLRTPAGRSMVENQAEIAGAMMQAGTILGQEVAMRVLERTRQAPVPHTP